MILEQAGAMTLAALATAVIEEISRSHFNALRSIGALLVVTLVPLLIDRRFRR